MDAPAAAQPVSRLCPACFFCFSWKLAPDKSAALQTEQKQEGSSPQVSYHCPKAAHSHTWMGQHQGCCHPENYGPLRPSLWLTHNSSQPGKGQTALGLGSLALLSWLTGMNLVMRRTGRLLFHNQSWACACSFVLASSLWRHFCMTWELPVAPRSWGRAVPGSSPFSLCWVRRWSAVTTQSWGLAQEGSAGSRRPAVTGSSLSSVGSFPSGTHWFSTKLLIFEALKMSSVEDCTLGPPITLFVFISP